MGSGFDGLPRKNCLSKSLKMYVKENIAFQVSDGIQLRGWFYHTQNKKNPPAIIMTHGFSALKEHGLKSFAEKFATKGFSVLVYDNRNFGESEGEPRFEVDPEWQVRDMSDAITFLIKSKKIDPTNIGLWGTSFSAGNVIVAAASDKRVSTIVLQTPFLEGHHVNLKLKQPTLWKALLKKYEMDFCARKKGSPPAMIAVVTKEPEKSAVLKQACAYEFFTKVPTWQNQVTLHSIENSGNYRPIDFIKDIRIPTLFIIAREDSICSKELALYAYEQMDCPKKCIMIAGDHFSPFEDQCEICMNEAAQWFASNLVIDY